MKITVIDGQGGNIGKNLVSRILALDNKNINLLAIGTNAMATASMIKAGATCAATGENPCVVAARDSDIIVGPIGIVIADSLYGEVTEKMAAAVSQSAALRILIPINKCNTFICTPSLSLNEYIDIAISKISQLL